MTDSSGFEWWRISREERFFTSMLFHDIRQEPTPFLNVLSSELPVVSESEYKEVAFEVSFFRDAGFLDLIDRRQHLEKQTFDLVIFLSGERMLIIEAKAQQGFKTKQLAQLAEARDLITHGLWPDKEVYLVALHSSLYSPRPSTSAAFNAHITWQTLSDIYPDNYPIYMHADSIYEDTKSDRRKLIETRIGELKSDLHTDCPETEFDN